MDLGDVTFELSSFGLAVYWLSVLGALTIGVYDGVRRTWFGLLYVATAPIAFLIVVNWVGENSQLEREIYGVSAMLLGLMGWATARAVAASIGWFQKHLRAGRP